MEGDSSGGHATSVSKSNDKFKMELSEDFRWIFNESWIEMVFQTQNLKIFMLLDVFFLKTYLFVPES